jgi:hypothetical protein
MVTMFVVVAPYGRKFCKQSFVYYGNPEGFTKIVCKARFGCLTYADKTVQGHTAHTTGGVVQTAQLRCWTEVECTRVRLRYGAERQLLVNIVTLWRQVSVMWMFSWQTYSAFKMCSCGVLGQLQWSWHSIIRLHWAACVVCVKLHGVGHITVWVIT